MTLEILICTYNDGIARAAQVPFSPTHNVSYLVSWQQDEGYAPSALPEGLKREDVKVVVTKGKGLSRNRNNAIDNATGDICLIADDDVSYMPIHVAHIIEVFESHPTLDVATFKYASRNYAKAYPSYSFDLRHPAKGYYVTSIEIAFRRTSIQGKIRFNELFGLNAPVLSAGEEMVFIHDAIKEDLSCFFFPYTIASHDHPTTSITRRDTPGYLMAQGACIWLTYKDGTAPLRYILFAWRNSSGLFGFMRAVKHVCAGAKYIAQNV